METNGFFASLRQELTNTQDLRFKFAMQKLIFIISLFGLGSISLKFDSLSLIKYLIYFIPFIAFMFDLYIIGENFGIRRIGNYLKFNENVSKDERKWEFLLNLPNNRNRDSFAIHGNLYSTFISIIVSSILIFFIMENNSDLFLDTIWFKSIWLGVVLVLSGLLLFKYPRKLNRNLLDFKMSVIKYSDTWDLFIDEEKKLLSSELDIKEIEKKVNELYDKDNPKTST